MAERVVDVLESVEVKEQHGDLAVPAVRAGDRLAHSIREQRAVRQTSERIMVGHVDDSLIREAPFGHFGLQPGVDTGELERALLDALLKRALRSLQRAL